MIVHFRNNQKIIKEKLYQLKSLPKGTKTDEYSGIINQGATCYLNSFIQSIFHIPLLTQMIFDVEPREGNQPIAALKILFSVLARKEQGVTTKELTESFGWDSLDVVTQQDVHDFATFFFTLMKESFPADDFNSLFRSEIGSFFYPGDGTKILLEKKTTMDFQVPFAGFRNLQDSINNIFKNEIYGKDGQNGMIGKEIIKFPPILFFHLNRYNSTKIIL